MKFKHSLFAALLVTISTHPVLAACRGDLLPDYIKNPEAVTGPGGTLGGCQLALIKIIAVHPDAQSKSRMPFCETGVLDLGTIESTGKALPMTFSVAYEQRHAAIMADCDTWDFITLKPGRELLAFFHSGGGKWTVPDVHAMSVVSNVERITPAERKQLQPFFQTRL